MLLLLNSFVKKNIMWLRHAVIGMLFLFFYAAIFSIKTKRIYFKRGII